MTKKEVNAAILIIGSEILSGRTKDLNTSTISSWLNTIGIKVIESRTVLDVENQIISNFPSNCNFPPRLYEVLRLVSIDSNVILLDLFSKILQFT